MMKGHRRDRREWAATLDFRDGREYGSRCSGTSDGVDIRDQLTAAGGREVICIHTHAGSTAFTPRDAEVLLANSNIPTIAVVGADRTLYFMSRDPSEQRDYARVLYDVEDTYMRKSWALDGTYRAIRRLGLMTERQAWREQTHETWERIRVDLGLLYDRVERPLSLERAPQ
jgi:hypothetical protein